MIDTKELRRLAQAATHPTTKGRWMRLFGERTVYDRMEDGCRGIPVVATPTSPPDKAEAAKLDFIAAANPANIADLLDRLEAAEKERDEALESEKWYQRRCELLQEQQSKMRDPERTMVCDILANGALLHADFAGDRYTIPGAQGEEK